jgi:beta-N-acetylhexosaminidase
VRVQTFLPLLFPFLLFSGCGKKTEREAAAEAGPAAECEEPACLPGADDTAYEQRRAEAARIVALMDDRLLAAQVIITGLDGKAALSGPMETLLAEIPAGGIMLFRYNLDAEKDRVRSFLARCSSLVATSSGIAPFMAVDHEGGLVHRFGPGVEKLPAAAAFWDLAEAGGAEAALEILGDLVLRSALEIRELGITMNFAPVAEVLNDENVRFLETRSYGPDPAFTEAAASAFIRAMDSAGIACALKHFPGNTGADPHGRAAVLDADKAELDYMAAPFAGIIRTLRPPALMVSHVKIPALDGERNASLSAPVMKDWIRKELGFSGLIISDDFSMGAVASSGLPSETAAVDALIAGADMVMTWPSTITLVYHALLMAVEEGRLPRQRLRDAAERIITEKIRYGLVSAGGRYDSVID